MINLSLTLKVDLLDLDCGNELTSGATIATDGCNMGCAGNATQACGGANRLSVYSSAPFAALPVPTAMKTNLPGKWTYAGCLRFVDSLRLLFRSLRRPIGSLE